MGKYREGCLADNLREVVATDRSCSSHVARVRVAVLCSCGLVLLSSCSMLGGVLGVGLGGVIRGAVALHCSCGSCLRSGLSSTASCWLCLSFSRCL